MTVASWVQWFVNDVPLQTLAFNISDQGKLNAPPPLRGDDVVIPHVPGRTFMGRQPDSRTLTLDMWVLGVKENGQLPTTETMQGQFYQNLRKLKNLFWNSGEQFRLTKKWREFGSETIRSATALAVFADGFDPTLQGGSRGTFTVDLYLSYPFFKDDVPKTLPFPNLATSVVDVTVEGDYETPHILIEITGSPTRPRFTTGDDKFITLDRVISGGASVDVAAWKAMMGTTKIVRNVKYGNSIPWFILKPGPRTIRASVGSGTGSATLTYTPLWL